MILGFYNNLPIFELSGLIVFKECFVIITFNTVQINNFDFYSEVNSFILFRQYILFLVYSLIFILELIYCVLILI